MEDIAQKLLRKIQENFGTDIDNSKRLKDIAKKIDENNATYDEINDYAFEIGNILAEAYKNNLSSDVLPEGRMGFEMANDIFIPTFENNYNMVCDVAVKVQKQINIANDIGLNVIQPQFNTHRINGIINKVVNTDVFDDVKGLLQSATINYTQSVVDDCIKENAEFHYKAGLTAIIKRHSSVGCCKWCASLVGTYIYPNVPKDVYRRHQNCNCKVEYLPEKGKRQDVWSKQWINENESSKIELRKTVGLIESNDLHINNGFIENDKLKIHSDKINKFLLKPGAKHSKEFFDVGYSVDDCERLFNDISQEFDIEKAEFDRVSEDGAQSFVIEMQLGVTKKKTFKTAWRIDKEGEKPRFVTAYRIGGKGK